MSTRDELGAYFDNVDGEIKRLDAHFSAHPLPQRPAASAGIDLSGIWTRAWYDFVWNRPYLLTPTAAIGWMDFNAARNPRLNLHLWVNGDDLAQVQLFESTEIQFYKRYRELGGVAGPEPKLGYVSPVEDKISWPKVALTATFAAAVLLGTSMLVRRVTS